MAACESDCTGNLFSRKCIHVVFMMFISTILVVFAIVELIRNNGVDSLYSGYYFGLITTVISYWATPPQIDKTIPTHAPEVTASSIAP
jgi:hypothetical protein